MTDELHDTERAVLARAAGENFPVALRVLPSRPRAALTALYGYARLVDETGDALGVARDSTLEALDSLEVELDRAFADCATHPVFVRLQAAIAAHGLGRRHLAALIDANRQDQRVDGYASWDELRGYCRLSAEPVGRLVLEVFDAATPERERWSDDVCSALQLLEHCQDVAEDLARGRVYMPADDMRECGCTVEMLSAASASGHLRSLIGLQVARSRALLASGRPLTASLSGAARVAIAGYVAGGEATARALERCGYDVLASCPRPSRLDILGCWLRLMSGRRRRQRPAARLSSTVGEGNLR